MPARAGAATRSGSPRPLLSLVVTPWNAGVRTAVLVSPGVAPGRACGCTLASGPRNQRRDKGDEDGTEALFSASWRPLGALVRPWRFCCPPSVSKVLAPLRALGGDAARHPQEKEWRPVASRGVVAVMPGTEEYPQPRTNLYTPEGSRKRRGHPHHPHVRTPPRPLRLRRGPPGPDPRPRRPSGLEPRGPPRRGRPLRPSGWIHACIHPCIQPFPFPPPPRPGRQEPFSGPPVLPAACPALPERSSPAGTPSWRP